MPTVLAGQPSPAVDPVAAEQGPRLILASASPRRQQLLREAGYQFVIHPANIDEDEGSARLLPAELARFLSTKKARAVADQFRGDIILAADTVVAFGDQCLGKPEDPADARRMLELLSDTTHIVLTAITVARAATRLESTRVVMSAVRMRHLTRSEIDSYVATGEWHGKAGGYGIQDSDPFVTRTAGSHTNIVGLPMETVAEMLAEAGIFPHA